MTSFRIGAGVASLFMAAAAFAASPPQDVVDTAVSAGSFHTLVAAVTAAGLVDTLKGDIAGARALIEGSGARIVLVHRGDSQAIEELMGKYGLAGVDRICDREQKLYRAFGLKRENLRQRFGAKVLWRAFRGGAQSRHGIGQLPADSFQMPGLFPIGHASIVRRYRHRSAADRPDYAGIRAAPASFEGGR